MNDVSERAMSSTERTECIDCIFSFHQRTKHHPSFFALGPDQLDWANQPDPFRCFAGATTIDLPLGADKVFTPYRDLYIPGAVAPYELCLESVAILFELALGLSAWKEYRGSRWALRCNPSSGNLHPTEGYAILPSIPGLQAGVYHYVSRDHQLEQRCTSYDDSTSAFAAGFPRHSFVVGLSSIHWREAWKYGERAYRYCQHDVGHALAAIRIAAAALGWTARLLDPLGDSEVAACLGIERVTDFAKVAPPDREYPDVLVLVGSPPLAELILDADIVAAGRWLGTANPLSREHVRWEVIERVARAACKPSTESTLIDLPLRPPLLPMAGREPATTLANSIIRQRRSALDFDGRSEITASMLYRLLDCLLPRHDVPPWDLLPWRPHVHLGLFVHRVRGLASGLYLFERDVAVHDKLRSVCRSTFVWQRPASCPEHLPLYLLAHGDLRAAARMMSCHQDLAADGAFSLAMIAEFADVIRCDGPWWYRRLFWEAGVIGQVIYLEAEAHGVRGTGIGCYFDDICHEMFGLANDRFQSLYHFAVGVPVEDARLRTIAPYAHLIKNKDA